MFSRLSGVLSGSLPPFPLLLLTRSRPFVPREGECAGGSTRVNILKGVAAGCRAGRYLTFFSFRSLFPASRSDSTVTFDCICLPAFPYNWSRADRPRLFIVKYSDVPFSPGGAEGDRILVRRSLIDRHHSPRWTAWRCWRRRPKTLFASHSGWLFRACWFDSFGISR